MIKRLDVIDHGATVRFTATFTDAAGQPTTPDSASVQLAFKDVATGEDAAATLAMAGDGGTFTVDWDSSVAAGNRPVFWNVRATGAAKISEFGRIDFNYNLAGLPD